jgi:hypothetical protein
MRNACYEELYATTGPNGHYRGSGIGSWVSHDTIIVAQVRLLHQFTTCKAGH